MVWGDWLFLQSTASTLQNDCFAMLTIDNIFLYPHTLFHVEHKGRQKNDLPCSLFILDCLTAVVPNVGYFMDEFMDKWLKL